MEDIIEKKKIFVTRKEIDNIYTPLSVAKEEIWRRWNDESLRKKVEDFLGGDIPECLMEKPKAIMVRYIMTPNYELKYFLDLAKITGLDYSLLEYSNDKFVARNPEKYHICKLFFHNGYGKKGGSNLETKNIVDFNKNEGKLLDDIETIWGEKLLDFHHTVIEKAIHGSRERIFNFSNWFQKHRTLNKQEYYLHYLALFFCYGILFENFLLDKGETEFTQEKVLPSFKKLEKIFGIKPLIVPLESLKVEEDNYWRYYSKRVKKVFIEEIRNKNKKNDFEKSLQAQMGVKFIIKDTGKYGLGVYAGEAIRNGQIIKILSGEIISFDECIKRIKQGMEEQTDSLQVGLEMDMDLDETSRTFNHNCNPNAGLRNISELFAIRNIKKGEEITYDYSATIGPNIDSSLWNMKCECGSYNCRKILGNVLTIPEKTLKRYNKLGAMQDYIKKELKKIKRRKDGSFILPIYKKIVIK